MKNYTFVSKAEYRELQQEILSIIKEVNKELKGVYSFTYNPVGSVEDNLVTWIEGSKKGFDVDYNLVLQSGPTNIPSEIVKDFSCAIEKAAKPMEYNIKFKTHVIKIKRLDRKQKYELSCDLALIKDSDLGREIITYDRNNDRYIWNQIALYKSTKFKLSKIKEAKLFNELRNEYLKLKNNNKADKCSYMLRLEATNNIFNSYRL